MERHDQRPHSGLTRRIIGCAIEVHKELGPGLLESAYSACLGRAFDESGIGYAREVVIPLRFRGIDVPQAYRADFIVEERVIVEVKSVELIEKIHRCQLLTYLRLTDLEIGLLLNFNVPVLKEGIHRLVHCPRRSTGSPAAIDPSSAPP